ncbi:ADP-ribose glycohydrolase OARD1 [Petromyzon marinus]|uniref:ADP-ribose glycohydrolase OARD1 n=1 Tax=Petromyzon marinus TaxID=7757 RepID=A0AAJ7SV45_PETMA|nr:ADP-ribose glycohydrolase OARD1 [Petromyzon marinus]
METAAAALTAAVVAKTEESMELKSGEFSIPEVQGDLFSCPPNEALAHCISADCRMGAGIAKIFKAKFSGTQELLTQAKKVGEVAVLERNGRFIYYLVTKMKAFNKPTYPDLESSLRAMRHHCTSHGVTAVSLPRIGCGLDKLQWDRVKWIMEKVFRDSGIKLTVYYL